jgi:hypothetical protein
MPELFDEPENVDVFDAETAIENAIRAYDKETLGTGALLTGWVVIAEWIDEDGHPDLTAFAREGMPYWRINSLIEAAPMEIVYDDDDD